MYQRILVPTDSSSLSKKAVQHAIALAQTCGAEVVVLNVVPRYPVSYLEGAVVFETQDVARIEKQWSEQARELVDKVVTQVQAKGVKARAAVVKSDLVAESIISAARKHKADLIVMASHGRKGIKRLLLGSETQHVLTHSTLPVLVLR
ncbi:universal stress protein [uncultured Pseudacidovorax sp.]|uniref:universal stress protein n=1 Tax=uncultured Pseudacidovorax sp. TaxID=679313 RepID=UPI0025EDDE4B|nr:universal stress protein [uncultured Pseudacidovorax sp.]